MHFRAEMGSARSRGVVRRGATTLSLGLALALAGCTQDFRDPSCSSTARAQTPFVTLAILGLFTERGEPIELPSAVVSCAQAGSAFANAQYRPEFGEGGVIDRGRLQTSLQDVAALNVYTCGLSGAVALRRCYEPLQIRVEAPGCEPYERTISWDENFDLNGPNQANFYVPVLLRCAADAGADPTMRDIPALNRDSGN